ncbi:MAG: hypothetical protein IMZ52_09665, partial [Actinobacteria bacterium]|nr:hypothetical protein [Actinomycetota bacterium]
VQFNDNGNFGADSNFTWNSITNTLNIAGSISSQKISSNKILTSEINSVNNLYISSLTDNINIIAYDSLYLKSKWKGIHLYAPYEGISISSLNGDIKVYADGTNIIINTERISGGSFLPIWPREVINKRWAERQFKPSTATGDGGTGGYPSGPRHAIQFKSGTSTSHGGDWHLTYSPLTNRFALTGGAWIKGSLSSQNISSNKIRSFYISTNHLSSNSLYGYIISCHTWKGPTIGGGDGASAFIDLTDVPNSYAGKIGRLPIVNATSDGLIFAEIVCVDNQIVFNDNSVVWA